MTEFAEGGVEFRILGPVQLLADGRMCDLGSPKERCVLAVLLYELGQPVDADDLADALWGKDPPGEPRSTLNVHISRLRKRMREATGDSRNRIILDSGCYTLDVDPGTVDLHRFRALRTRARTACEDGNDEQAAISLHDAEMLWRGSPLAGVAGDWVARIRKTLEEERLSAIRERIEVNLRLGRHNDLVGEIADHVARHPHDQRLIGHLMIALYRCGRSAEALETYRRTHRRFADEYGTDPGPELRDLHQRMLTEDPQLVILPQTRTAQSNGRKDNLPRDNPHFVGRAPEIDKMRGWISSQLAQATVTVVAISGMAGVGKSALAIHLGRLLDDHYPNRLYLNLHTHDPLEEPVDPLSGLGILLRTLGVPPERVPVTLEERATLWRTLLANQRTLIVLDDADNSEQVRPLLPGAPGCLVLITCRRRMMGIPGVFSLPLDIMGADDASSLFAQVVGPDRIANPAEIGEVVRLCAHLPLAIQIVGSRFRKHATWSISDLTSQLSRSQSDAGHIDTEYREVAASLELSYRYLTREQQRVFRRLALHPGPDFSVHMATAATGDDSLSATEQALEALLDHHLIDERFRGRYRFHDLIHQYARHRAERDEQASDLRDTEHRILDYYLYMAEQTAEAVFPFHQLIHPQPTYVPVVQSHLVTPADFRNWIEAERENILSVIHFAARNGWSQHVSLLPHLMAQFLDTWGYWADAIVFHRLAVRAWREIGSSSEVARSLTDLANSLAHLGRHAEALEFSQSALKIFSDHRDRAGEAGALDCMGLILWRSSQFQEALSCHEKALVIWRDLDDRHGEAEALGHSSFPLWHTGKYDAAMECLVRALTIFEELGDLQGVGKAQNNIGELEQHFGNYNEALDRYHQALAISQNLGDRQGESIMLNNIGNICRQTGQYCEALDYYREALRIYKAIGERRCESDALNNLGMTFQLTGHYGEALIHHQKALALAHELSEPYQEARSIYYIGNAHLRNKRYESAADNYRFAIELSHRIGDHYQEARALEGLGDVLLQTDGETAARECWQKTLELFERIGLPDADAVRHRLELLDATKAYPPHGARLRLRFASSRTNVLRR